MYLYKKCMKGSSMQYTKKFMKRFILKAYPYGICVVAGTLLFIVASELNGNANSLLVGISGAFFAIPCLYLLYESAQKFSNKKLNKELFEYAKMQIDRDIMPMVNQLIKMVYTYDKSDTSIKGWTKFLSLCENDIVIELEKNEYLGFQAFKEWSVSTKNITTTLESPFILRRFNNEQVTTLIHILESLTSLELLSKRTSDLFVVSEKQAEGYKLKSGIELNKQNVGYSDRYILLKHLAGDKYIVTDFGDFPQYHVSKLLNFCKMNVTYLSVYAGCIFSLKSALNEWVNITGSRLVMDPKMCANWTPKLKE